MYELDLIDMHLLGNLNAVLCALVSRHNCSKSNLQGIAITHASNT